MGNWIDISQPLNRNLAHWPEDTPFQYETPITKEMSGSVNIGQMTTSTHIGTHVDAPFHFSNDGKRILDLDINRYIGHCKVVDLSEFRIIDEKALKSKNIPYVERLLIKTALPNDPTRFPDEVAFITPDAAAYMNTIGVKLVGVDTPSVDAINSKELAGHHALHKQDIYILENVMLDGIEEGGYELVALPLALEEADGSPVRAVIRPIKEGEA
ncbi:MAG TPA: arylformamidase [Virgibacillus sp.]|nr:arylformamidase [Virgibacillus sp.]